MTSIDLILILISIIGILLGSIAVWYFKSATMYINRWPAITMILALGLLAIGGVLNIWKIMFPVENLPHNVKLQQEMWQQYNAHNYRKAISIADKCIDLYQYEANNNLAKLQEDKEPFPPIGIVKIDEKQIILAQGLLNDVGTCWFIKGRSLEELGIKQQAIEAYCQTSKFNYARTYDPTWDGFWSPSQAAVDRIAILAGNCN